MTGHSDRSGNREQDISDCIRNCVTKEPDVTSASFSQRVQPWHTSLRPVAPARTIKGFIRKIHRPITNATSDGTTVTTVALRKMHAFSPPQYIE
jgi:hypothetical protein